MLVVPLAASVLLAAGCAAGDASTGAPSLATAPTVASSPPSTPGVLPSPTAASAAPSSAPAFDGTVVTVDVAAGEVETESKRVKVDQGAEVRLVVTSDETDEIHIHGVDDYVDLPAGQTVTYDFTASVPGTYEVELHDAGTVLFSLQVQ